MISKCLTILYGVLLLILIVVGLIPKVKAESRTRSWEILSRKNPFLNGNIFVVDTTGVCLYTIIAGMDMQMVAVPKTQLPAGTGCE